jgi:hypothetical protein
MTGKHVIERVRVTGPEGLPMDRELADHQHWKNLLQEMDWDPQAQPFAKTK